MSLACRHATRPDRTDDCGVPAVGGCLVMETKPHVSDGLLPRGELIKLRRNYRLTLFRQSIHLQMAYSVMDTVYSMTGSQAVYVLVTDREAQLSSQWQTNYKLFHIHEYYLN